MSNRGRHKKKNKKITKIKIRDHDLNCYVTFLLENGTIKNVIYDK